MLGDERNSDASVRLHNVEHHLGANVLQQIFNIVADEGIIVDGAPAKATLVRLAMVKICGLRAHSCGNGC